jgi:integrase
VYELCQKTGVNKSTWYDALKKPAFVTEVQALKVKVGKAGISHLEVRLAVNPETVLEADIWDMRRLKTDYPKHRTPSSFKIDFTTIENPILRQQLKHYFRHHLSQWEPQTFKNVLHHLRVFFRHFPLETHVGTLNRTQIESILPQIYQLSSSAAFSCLRRTRAMLEYMAISSEWTGVRPTPFLIWKEDIPFEQETFPRPIPPDVVQQLDTLLDRAIQAIKASSILPTPSPVFWDAILILRRTGMRFEDLAHLKVSNDQGQDGCLDQDPSGYWWIRLHNKINKMGKPHRIPTRMSDGAVEAILRQKERVKAIPNYFGENYLFRTSKQRGTLSYSSFWASLANLAPLLIHEGQPYKITPHQFRHTIATDMIEQGVDVYTVKEFLGHASLEMTERYIKVYLTSLKAKYDTYRSKIQQSYASEIISQVQMNQPSNDVDGGWVDGKIGKLYVSPLPDGIGNCVHLAMLDPCPTPPHCPTCPKLRVSKRHLPVWENKAKNLLITVEVLRSNPKFARAQKKHEQELQHAERVIETIKQEGVWNGEFYHSSTNNM